MIYAKRIKRILDFALSSFALLLFSPVFMILTVVGFFAVKGNPFFVQERPGLQEKIFKLIKFRTMSNEKDEAGNLLPDEMRLNSYGRFLRAASLDELPELLNIWKGDMAIVGPRPLLTRYLPFYTETERKRHTVRPGLTGLAQISGRNALAWDSRLALDVKYAEHITFLGDVKIILMTVVKVIKREDVVDAGSFEMLDLDQERKSSVADHKSNP
jgi:lipopolysaccharide/colanic/teichoic acid biosynthesis glycosyltransferase